jgi:hypothetical protein
VHEGVCMDPRRVALEILDRHGGRA